MKIRGWHIPLLPILTGGIAGHLAMTIIRDDLSQWDSTWAILYLPNCLQLCGIPILLGALLGGIIGMMTAYVLNEDIVDKEIRAFLGAILTIIVIGLCVFVIIFFS